MHFTTEKVTSKCDFLSLKQVYAHFCTALYVLSKKTSGLTRIQTKTSKGSNVMLERSSRGTILKNTQADTPSPVQTYPSEEKFIQSPS